MRHRRPVNICTPPLLEYSRGDVVAVLKAVSYCTYGSVSLPCWWSYSPMVIRKPTTGYCMSAPRKETLPHLSPISIPSPRQARSGYINNPSRSMSSSTSHYSPEFVQNFAFKTKCLCLLLPSEIDEVKLMPVQSQDRSFEWRGGPSVYFKTCGWICHVSSKTTERSLDGTVYLLASSIVIHLTPCHGCSQNLNEDNPWDGRLVRLYYSGREEFHRCSKIEIWRTYQSAGSRNDTPKSHSNIQTHPLAKAFSPYINPLLPSKPVKQTLITVQS